MGEVWDKAVTYQRQAGAKAFSQAANRDAVQCFERALLALAHLPEDRDRLEQAIDLRFELRNALLALGEFQRIVTCLREAESLAEALDDQRRLGRVFAYMIVHFSRMGDYDRAVEAGQRALAIAQAIGDFALGLVANQYLGTAYYYLAEYRRAIELLGRGIESLQSDQNGDRFGQLILPSVQSRAWLTCCYAQLGEFTEGITVGDQGLRIAETVDHQYSRALAYLGLGVLHLLKGDASRAIAVLERGFQLCEALTLAVWLPEIASILGAAYVLQGRAVEALPLLERAVELTSSRGDMRGHSLRVANLSEGYLLAGRIDEAIHLAERALQLSRDTKERGNEAWTLRLLGAIGAHDASPSDAETAELHYRGALALTEGLGMRPLVSHCHLGLGKLYRRTGKREQAQEHLATATTMYREMDMAFWLEKVEAEMKECT
jgi:tetratricopeptide (TPR) repeat protein